MYKLLKFSCTCFIFVLYRFSLNSCMYQSLIDNLSCITSLHSDIINKRIQITNFLHHHLEYIYHHHLLHIFQTFHWTEYNRLIIQRRASARWQWTKASLRVTDKTQFVPRKFSWRCTSPTLNRCVVRFSEDLCASAVRFWRFLHNQRKRGCLESRLAIGIFILFYFSLFILRTVVDTEMNFRHVHVVCFRRSSL